MLAMMSASLLMAEEIENTVEIQQEVVCEREPVGTRPISHQERMNHQAKRASRDDEAKANPASAVRALKIEYSSHMGAFHHPAMITPLGDMVELEDGSRWLVNFSDRFKTYNWLTSDTLKITPNHTWFSSYYFRITNLNTNESIEVNLFERPFYNGIFTYWIIAIDYFTQQICLNDGSVWDLSSFDYDVYKKWILNDTIILGHNDGFFSSSRPNILINCDTETYVEARCIN